MAYKIKDIELTNFAKFSNIKVSFDENVTYLVAPNGQGKSTIGLTGIWVAFAGLANKNIKDTTHTYIGDRFRFIGNDSAIAKDTITLYDKERDVEIVVTRKIVADGSSLSFTAPEGLVLDQAWLTSLFNIFLINPRAFWMLTPKEQSRVLGIDTEKYDKELADLKNEFTLIGRDIKSFGTLVPVEETKEIDVSELNKEKNAVIKFNDEQKAKQTKINEATKLLNDLKVEKAELEKKLSEINKRIETGADVILKLPAPKELKDTSNIDKQINSASETNKKALEYTSYIDKKTKYDKKVLEQANNKVKQTECENNRIAYIKSKKLPFDTLSINESGELLLQDRPIQENYFSSGELLKVVPVLMSALNPELKYVFIQQFNLIDDKNQKQIIDYLLKKGFQLVIEYVANEAIVGQNCIVLSDVKTAE